VRTDPGPLTPGPVDELDIPQELAVAVGEERRLRLPGLGTAGYIWQPRIEGDDDVVEVSVAPVPDDEAGDGGVDEPVGRSLDEQVTIRGRRPGRVVVRLVQRRPWERTAPPLREAALQVIVS
jgi:predicted secreted protein